MCLRAASMPRRCRRTPDAVMVCSTPVAQQQLLSLLLLLLLLVHDAGAAPGTIKVGTCQEGYAPMVIPHEDGTFTGLEVDQVRVLVFPLNSLSLCPISCIRDKLWVSFVAHRVRNHMVVIMPLL